LNLDFDFRLHELSRAGNKTANDTAVLLVMMTGSKIFCIPKRASALTSVEILLVCNLQYGIPLSLAIGHRELPESSRTIR
jgi:hypothetical protein